MPVEVLEKFSSWRCIGKVAAAFAGNTEFAGWFCHRFDNTDPQAIVSRLNGCHQTGRTGTDNQQIDSTHFFFTLKPNCPICRPS